MKYTLFGLSALSLLSAEVMGGLYTIDLKTRTFDPMPGFLVSDILNQAGAPTSGIIHFFLQFTQVPRTPEKSAVEGLGFEFIDFVGGPGSVGAYIMATDVNNLSSVSGLPNARWAGPILATDKIHPRLSVPIVTESAVMASQVLNVMFYSPTSELQKNQTVENCGGTVITSSSIISVFTAEFPPGQVLCLAEQDAVEYVSETEFALGPTNDQARVAANVVPLAEDPYNLDGNGVTILVYDVAVVDEHPDFNARVIEREPGRAVASHATHVCGTCCGDGTNSDGLDSAGNMNPGTPNQWQGMAPNVLIRSFGFDGAVVGDLFYNDLGDIEANFNTAIRNGIDLATMSLGDNTLSRRIPGPCENLGDYSETAQLVDRLVVGMNDEQQQLIFFQSAGNDRNDAIPAACTEAARIMNGYARITTPGTSKNGIVLGAINSNDNSMTTFSSWGPTDDGRVKPDIVAPGCQVGGDDGITSTDFIDTIQPGDLERNGLLDPNEIQNAYSVKCGTSMATPVASGTAALLIEQWQRLNGAGTRPLPHTVKAIMIHTADDLNNPVPTYEFGWGALNAQAAIDLVRADDTADLIHIADANQDDVDTFTFNSCGTEDVRVTLVWDDPPATPLDNPTLQHNLDLRVTSPSGDILQPMVLNPAMPQMPPAPGNDDVNNVEMVIAQQRQCGTWQVTVTGTRVTVGDQQEYTLITPADEPQDPPDLTCPADDTIECIEDNLPINTGMATATNGCGPVEVVSSDGMLSGACGGSFTRTWTATNECGGNTNTCDQEITVKDTIAPEITCPPDAIIEKCKDDISSASLGTATATDNCNGQVTIIENDSSDSDKACKGTITRTWTATDECGNESTCEQVIQYNAKPPSNSFCFSGENSVEVQGKGVVSIDSLKIGDWVRVSGNNKYAQVYSLGHWNKHQEAAFFQITAKTTTAEMTIEATANHLLYLLNDSALKTISASDIEVGDLVVSVDNKPARVIRVGTVKRNGIFAPFTTTGDIVVSGLVASNYATIYNEKKAEFPVSFHWIAHSFKGIHRMACIVNFNWCKNEAYTADGISDWVPQWHLWFGRQGTRVQVVMMVLMLPMLFIMASLEKMFQSVVVSSMVAAGLAFFYMYAKKAGKVWKVKSI